MDELEVKNNALAIEEEVEDVTPRIWDDVQRERDRYLRSFFDEEQWRYICRLEAKGGDGA